MEAHPTPPVSTAAIKPNFRRSRIILAVTIGVSILTYAALPDDLGELGRRAVAIGVFAAIMWATEAIPLYATSLSVIGLEVLLLARKGGLAGEGELSHTQFFEPFASSTIILFMGGFLLAAAVTKHHLDRAIAARLLRPFMGDSYKLILAVILTTGFLSIWISNTATAAMMLAIIAPLIRDPATPRRLVTSLVLAVAFGASVGGIATPVSTPPNAITISQLRAVGIYINFVEWMLMAVPLAAVMLSITGVLLCVILRPPRRAELAAIEPPARITWEGWATVGILSAAVIGWFTGPWHKVDDAAVALIAATALAAPGVLTRRDVRSIDWDVLLLMWGGLALGNALHLTNVLEYVGRLPLFQDATGWVLALLIIIGGMVFATFMSNTAAANILVPLAIALASGGMVAVQGDGSQWEVARLGVLAGLTVSFAISMPISTPPNAMAYATGAVSARDMIRVGLLVSCAAVGMLMVGYLWVLPLVLR